MTLIQYWREGAIIALLATAYLLYDALTISKMETNQYRSALDYQNDSLLAQKQSYDKKLADLPKEIEVIKTRYKVIYQNINTWKGDENATELQNVDNFLNSIKY